MDNKLWCLAASTFNSEKVDLREQDGRLELFVRGVLKCAAWSPRCSATALAELLRWRLARLERLAARKDGEPVRVRLVFDDDEPLDDHTDDAVDPRAYEDDADGRDHYDATGVVRVRFGLAHQRPDDRSDGNDDPDAQPSISDEDDDNGKSSP